MIVKSKSFKSLNKKINECKDKKVIKFLNKLGYKCEYTKESLLNVINQLKSENKKVMIYKENEKLQKLNGYYKYEVISNVKIESIK